MNAFNIAKKAVHRFPLPAFPVAHPEMRQEMGHKFIGKWIQKTLNGIDKREIGNSLRLLYGL